MPKRSEIVVALCNMASQGRYDNVRPKQMVAFNRVFELAAQLINELEAEEKEPLTRVSDPIDTSMQDFQDGGT